LPETSTSWKLVGHRAPRFSFFQGVARQGITVVYLSNRDEKLRNSTIAALRQNGLSLEGIDNRLLLKTTTSDKTERRKIAEGRFNALIYLGDNLRDFSEEFKAPQLASNDEAGQKKPSRNAPTGFGAQIITGAMTGSFCPTQCTANGRGYVGTIHAAN
jgi:predicted secreted acid phosphatase